MLGAISKSEAYESPASVPLSPTRTEVNPCWRQLFKDELASIRATCANSERLATGHIRSGTSS